MKNKIKLFEMKNKNGYEEKRANFFMSQKGDCFKWREKAGH